MERMILDTKNAKKSNGFVLDLTGLENIKNINLDLNSAILDIEASIKNNDYVIGEDQIKILRKISNYGTEKVDLVKIKYYYNKIIYKFKNLDKDSVEDNINLFLEISFFMRYYLSLRYKGLGIIFKEYIEEIKEIKEQLKIDELLKLNYIEENKKANIIEIRLIKKYLEKCNSIEKEDLISKLKHAINDEFKKIQGLDEIEVANSLRNILGKSYEENFFSSIEFLNVTLDKKYSNFENYDDLLDYINKEYLLYRFNESKSGYEKADILFEFEIKDYMNLPSVIREIIVNKLMVRRERYNVMEEFFDILQDEIEKLKKIKNIDFVPIRI